MSLDTKLYKRIIPVEPDLDPAKLDELRWYTRESFELTATERGLQIVDFTESTVPATQIPPKNAKHLEHPIAHYVWHQFLATAQRIEIEPPNPVCGYCTHPPHTAGECPADPTPWLTSDSESCPCAVTT